MIYTLTLNPSIDMNITTNKLYKNASTHTKDMVLTANGKGINVAFVLQHFGSVVGAIGFFCGFTGRYIVDCCERKGVKVVPIWMEGENRINVFLTENEVEYKLVNEGPCIESNVAKQMLQALENLSDMEVLTINGSAARNLPVDFYEKIIQIVSKKNALLVLDISSLKLKDLLAYKPLLIKPNDEELEKIFGLKITDVNSIKDAMIFLNANGAQNILLTLGSKGSYFYNGTDLFHCGTQPVKVRSSLCTGDGFLAAFLHVWLKDRNNVAEALKLASAVGANIAESDGIGTLEMVDIYKQNIQVKNLSKGVNL